MVQAGDRTRLVLNLKEATTYKAELQGKSVLVSLEPVAGCRQVAVDAFRSSPRTATATRCRCATSTSAWARTSTGRVIVDLANNQVGVDIRQQGKNLVVEFTKSTLPEGLRRRLDVADFGTPVQTVTTHQQGERVRMTIEPQGRVGAQRLPEREPVRGRSASRARSTRPS